VQALITERYPMSAIATCCWQTGGIKNVISSVEDGKRKR